MTCSVISTAVATGLIAGFSAWILMTVFHIFIQRWKRTDWTPPPKSKQRYEE